MPPPRRSSPKPSKRRRVTTPANAYLESVERRLRAVVNADENAYIRNVGKGPFNKVELKYSPSMKRLILKDVQTKEAERRKGHFKRLLNAMDRLAAEKKLRSVEIQSILSPHIRGMLPWRNFPAVSNYGSSSVKRYTTPNFSR